MYDDNERKRHQMKITAIETMHFSYPFSDEQRWYTGAWDHEMYGMRFHAVIVQVHTDEGITGLGEGHGWMGPDKIMAAIRQAAPRFIGRSPFDVEKLTVPGPDNLQNNAIGPIDVALWDIIGKATNTPVYRLLAQGAEYKPEHIRTYASGGVSYAWFKDPEVVIEEALRYKAQGFTAFKMRTGTSWGVSGVTTRRFIALLERVRDAIGYDMDLMVDANCRLPSVEMAVEIGKALTDLKAAWFEEPVPYNDPAPYVEIRRQVGVPISGGEGMTDPRRVRTFLDAGAYDIYQPEATWIGLTTAYRMAMVAHSKGLPCIPHSWTNAIAAATAAHLVAAIPNRRFLEVQQINNPMLTEIVDEPIPANRGYIDVPDKPGLGIELNMDALRRFPPLEGGIMEDR
jgi:L-alanine-DL-glutamate epimerase-like enolase superfamily enzyme